MNSWKSQVGREFLDDIDKSYLFFFISDLLLSYVLKCFHHCRSFHADLTEYIKRILYYLIISITKRYFVL